MNKINYSNLKQFSKSQPQIFRNKSEVFYAPISLSTSKNYSVSNQQCIIDNLSTFAYCYDIEVSILMILIK